jgi:hypothetical protein
LDIWISVDPENAERLVAALKAFRFDLPELSPKLFLAKERIIRMGNPPIRIEIWTDISGVEFGDCYLSRIIDELDDVKVNIINLNQLKVNKKAAGRHKDLDDLDHLP